MGRREHVPETCADNPAGWWKLKGEVEAMSDDELLACGLRRVEGTAEPSHDDERFAARARIIEQCIAQGLGLTATVAFLDLLERGVSQ